MNDAMDVGRVIVLGYGGVGKTSCVSVFSTNTFADEYDPTLFDEVKAHVIVDQHNVVLTFEESGYQEERMDTENRYRRGDAFMFVYSIPSRESFQELNTLRTSVLAAVGKPTVPAVIVGNKKDLANDPNVDVIQADALQLANAWHCQHFEVSAKSREGIQAPLEALATKLLILHALMQAGEGQRSKKCTLL